MKICLTLCPRASSFRYCISCYFISFLIDVYFISSSLLFHFYTTTCIIKFWYRYCIILISFLFHFISISILFHILFFHHFISFRVFVLILNALNWSELTQRTLLVWLQNTWRSNWAQRNYWVRWVMKPQLTYPQCNRIKCNIKFILGRYSVLLLERSTWVTVQVYKLRHWAVSQQCRGHW